MSSDANVSAISAELLRALQVRAEQAGVSVDTLLSRFLASPDDDTASAADDYAALSASEQQLRSLIESQTAYVVRTDMNGNYTYGNGIFLKKFAHIIGPPENLRGMPSLTTIVPEDHPKTIAAAYACARQPGKPVPVVLGKPLENGAVAWIMWEFVALTDRMGNATEIQCMGIDITELIEARQRLELQESALQSAANAIVITNRSGVIEWTNPAFTTLTGYTAEEVRGQHTSVLKSGAHDRAFYADLWNTVLAGKVWRGRLVNKRKDGSRYTEELTITPVYNPTGELAHFIAIKQDVSERERAEHTLLETERLAARLQKEQEFNILVQRAVSALSHDVRTPLTIISNAKEILSRYFDRLDEDKRQEKLDSIGKQLHYVIELLDDMTLFVKGSLNHKELKLERLNLPALCQACITEIEQMMGGGHNLRFDTDGQITYALADETLVSRILLNLLSNAVKFSPVGSEIHLSLCRRADWIILTVVDHGIGIAPGDLPHIFEPFFRAENAADIGGTGLGLNIVKECVERHHGAIFVESQIDAGSTFSVELPLHPA